MITITAAIHNNNNTDGRIVHPSVGISKMTVVYLLAVRELDGGRSGWADNKKYFCLAVHWGHKIMINKKHGNLWKNLC